MNVVIGTTVVDLQEQRPEGLLNNFVADLMRERAGREMGQPVDIALTNLGGLRSDIPKGPITLGKVYELMPFENELVVLYFSGEQIRELAREIAESGGEAISGMRIKYSNGQLTELTVGGEKVRDENKYSLATSDYLSAPGRKRLSILGTVPRNFIGVTIRQAIIDHIKEIDGAGEKISTDKDGRIQLQ
jgi:2',3'-cyclic-nucleotide 2'-phosphodiesterase (5'-nucleotidase family)